MKNNLKRIVAMAVILLIVACVFLTLYFAVTGNANFLGMLLLTLMLPILLWVYLFFYKLLKDKRK